MHMDLKNIDNFHLFLAGITPNVSKEQKLKERSVHAWWEMLFLDVPEGSILGPFLFGNLGFV